MKTIDGVPIKEGTKNEVDLDAFAKKIEEAKKEIQKSPEPETEDEEEYEYDVSEEEEQHAIPKNKEKKTDYSNVVEAMPELKQDLDYLLIVNKLKNGEKCSAKELEFKQVYEEAKQKEQVFNEANAIKEQEELERQKNLQEQINKEYEEYKTKFPQSIETYDEKSISLKGSDNFLKIALTFLALKKSKKKGGKIFIKVARPKKVSIEWTTKDIRFVEFWSTNERGDKVKEVSRVNQYEYTFEGTSIPVIFAIQGFAEAWDFYSEFKKDLSSEVVSGIAMEAYNTGYKDGLVVSDKKKDNPMAKYLNDPQKDGEFAGLSSVMEKMTSTLTSSFNTLALFCKACPYAHANAIKLALEEWPKAENNE